jgi:hypothetical protein
MNKRLIILLSSSVTVLGIVLAIILIDRHTEKKAFDSMCPKDVMVCPDGSTVARVAPSCSFAVCREQNKEVVVVPDLPHKEVIDETQGGEAVIIKKQEPVQGQTRTPIIHTVAVTITSPLQKGVAFVEQFFNKEQTPAQQQATPQAQQQATPNPNKESPSLNETRFSIKENSIVDQTGATVASLLSSSASGSSTPSGWSSHYVNAVEVGKTLPVVDGVPVEGAVGKYYVSENSFGPNQAECLFSNKIYIFDTTTNSKTLLYEENNSTLSKDDQRACNSEIYLLATDNEKLVLKYHTINTNMTCESTWSEPDKTWYLTVTSLANGMSRYYISPEKYGTAEAYEATCRENLLTP